MKVFLIGVDRVDALNSMLVKESVPYDVTRNGALSVNEWSMSRVKSERESEPVES